MPTEIDILGGQQTNQFVDINSQTLINWCPIITSNAEKNITKKALRPLDGLTSLATIANKRTVRGQVSTNDRHFSVIDNNLYELTGSVLTSLGTIGSGVQSSPVFMIITDSNQLFIAESGGTTGYVFDLDSNILTQITDPEFLGVESVDYSDSFVFTVRNGFLRFSESENALTWRGDDALRPTFVADKLLQVVCFKEELYLFGTQSISIYINDSNGTSVTFSRLQRSTTSYGVESHFAAAKFDQGIFFVGHSTTTNSSGGRGVYLIDQSYKMTPVSTQNIEEQLNKADSLAGAEGFIEYCSFGDVLYHLSVPNLNKTFVYSLKSQQWLLRQSQIPTNDADLTPVQGMYRGRNICGFRGKTIVGDRYSGTLYYMDSTNSLDGDLPRIFEFTSNVLSDADKWISVAMLQILVNTAVATLSRQGSDPKIMISISTNGGHTFGSPKHLSLSKLNEYKKRLLTTRLGTARRWVIKLQLTDPVLVTILNATMIGTIGEAFS